jgi:hypothetical protein
VVAVSLLLTIREGRNRQVRRMCEAVGHPVQALKRTRVGPIADRKLKAGEWRELTMTEVAALKKAAVRPAKKQESGIGAGIGNQESGIRGGKDRRQ